MTTADALQNHLKERYNFKGRSITLGAAMYGGKVMTGTEIGAPLKTLNRHGLICGATGTGKTKTLQVMAEGLADAGVPVLLMDIKGDLSGLAKPGVQHPKIEERHAAIGLPYIPSGYTVEPLSISADGGVRLRATVSELGPVLLAKMLELNDAQAGIIALLFKYCDDHQLPLLDLADLKRVLRFSVEEGSDALAQEYGRISKASVGTIQRKVVALEQQGADRFFGEKSFDPADLLRQDDADRGIISVLRLTDIQDRPKLFSTFMLSLLAEVYATFPEQGDVDAPILAIFIDEAHLVFDQSSKALLQQLTTIVKLIRSKGVGVFFCTQSPADVPEDILSQLGLRVQHALRAFTAKDRKRIKLIAENFPPSDYYKTDELLTSMGIGEALITALDEKGIPTPLAATMLVAPRSRMGILSAEELEALVNSSELASDYNEAIDRRSAYEILNEKLEAFRQHGADEHLEEKKKTKHASKEEPSLAEQLSKNTMVRQLGRTVMREVTRGLLGALGVKATTRRRRSHSLW
jgi:DNA helicase HerA-like ATPase